MRRPKGTPKEPAKVRAHDPRDGKRGPRKYGKPQPPPPPETERNKQDRVPWTKIREEYVTDETATIFSLASKYRLHPNTVGERAREEGWTLLRRQHQQAFSEEVRRRVAEALADELVEAQRELLDVTRAIVRNGGHRYAQEFDIPEEMRNHEDHVEETEFIEPIGPDKATGSPGRGERVLKRASSRRMRRQDFGLVKDAMSILRDMTAPPRPAAKGVEKQADEGQDEFVMK